EDGDISKPDIAAAVAIEIALRMLFTTKGAMLYIMRAGMGEAVIAPLYEVLRDRGVKFEFFRRLDQIVLAPGGRSIQKLVFTCQAEVVNGEYIPTAVDDQTGLVYWPSAPFWPRLRDGAEMQRAEVNFESHWYKWRSYGTEELMQGDSFDEVVLAIPVGAFSKLNQQDHCIAEELIAANPRFRQMTENIGLIPTLAAQLWCTSDLAGLGWSLQRPAAVGASEPLSIWADMSEVMRFEKRQAQALPASLQYFCGVYGTTLFRRPSNDASVPDIASRQVHDIAIDWLEKFTRTFLPIACNSDSTVNWNFLYARSGAAGIKRFDSQYWRANIDPTECIPSSAVRSAKWRLAANESGFDHLYLAGDWVKTGLDVSSAECAVMAGMQAARAICGSPRQVAGENFLWK
ncbi:MAG: hypothetical protein JO266_19005, partial [Acidobacteria bacterium]|nr:hypothetical protein [Acidobacteriota bacterium]